MSTKPRGGGVKALVLGPLKNDLFRGFQISFIKIF